jgi:hypothetical protein
LCKVAKRSLVDLHSLTWCGPAYRWHLGVVCLAVIFDRLVVDVGLEALAEVVCAHACNDNGEDEEENGEHGEGGQGLARWLVVVLAVQVGNVHADELEQEVRHGDEVHNDDRNHARDGFATDPPRSEEEKKEGDDQGDSGQGEFNGLGVFDDNQKLDGEGEEEEEVELEEGDINLYGQHCSSIIGGVSAVPGR